MGDPGTSAGKDPAEVVIAFERAHGQALFGFARRLVGGDGPNFAALSTVGVVVAVGGSPAARTVWLVGLALSVAAALAWARLFFARHSLWPAAMALIASAVLTVPIVVAAWNTRIWAGALLLPYNVWVALAASLSVGYALRN